MASYEKKTRYRKVSTKIQNDRKFRESSGPLQLLFYILLTHPHLTPLGTLRTGILGLAEELDWEKKGFPEAFPKVFWEGIEKGFWQYDQEAKCLWLPKFIKHNGPESPNVVKSWAGCLEDIPECELKDQAIQASIESLEGKGEAWQEALREAFGKPSGKAYPHPSLNQKQKQKQKQYSYSPSDKSSGESSPPDEPAGDLLGVGPESKIPPCPQRQIIELYHEILPMLPPMRVWNEDSQRRLRARWREDPDRQTLEWWRELFQFIRDDCPFLLGRVKDFQADLYWIVGPKNIQKIINGFYQRRDEEVAP